MIAIGCDHGGFVLKQEIIKFLESAGYEYEDFGTYSEESCDYPVYAKKVAHAVADGKCEGNNYMRNRNRCMHHCQQGKGNTGQHLCMTVFPQRLQGSIMMPMS